MHKKQNHRKIVADLYKQNLQNFINFVGTPSGIAIRDYSLLIMAIVYILCGVLITIFPDNIILNKIGYENQNWLLIGLFDIGGIFMLIDWLFLANKIYWGNKGKTVTAEKCWGLLKGLFVFLLPLIYAKKLISYILCETRQKVIITYIPEVFLSLLFTFVLFLTLEIRIIKGAVSLIECLLDLSLTNEFIMLCMVVMLIFTFFISCKGIIHISIKWFVKKIKRSELKKTNTVNVSDTMKSKYIIDEINNESTKLMQKADEELKYSELYFYVIVNIILLSLHFEEASIYEKLFADEFMGVTTLAALFREVDTKREQKSENRRDKVE